MSYTELKKIRQLTEERIKELLPNASLKTFVLSGSKMIRSKLAILYLKSNNSDINDSIIKLLTAGELVHNASLLHDDVIDDSAERRGISTIGTIFSPKISIICGDYIISKAIELISEINNSNITTSFTNCVQKMSEAEIKQFMLRNKIPTKEEYLEICEGKTATLFETILESCTIINTLNTNIAKSFAKNFGLCFQLNNDFQINSAKEDIKNGIYTAKDILGIENTKILSDNYKREMLKTIEDFPQSLHVCELKELIKGL